MANSFYDLSAALSLLSIAIASVNKTLDTQIRQQTVTNPSYHPLPPTARCCTKQSQSRSEAFFAHEQHSSFVMGFISLSLGSGKFSFLFWSWNHRLWSLLFHTLLDVDFPSVGSKEGKLIHNVVVFLSPRLQDSGRKHECDCPVQE